MRSVWKAIPFWILVGALAISSFPITALRSPYRSVGILPYEMARIAESASSSQVTSFTKTFVYWLLGVATFASMAGFLIPYVAKQDWRRHLKRFDRDVLGFRGRRRKVLASITAIVCVVAMASVLTWLLKLPRWWVLLLFFVVAAVAFEGCAYLWAASWKHNRRLWEGR